MAVDLSEDFVTLRSEQCGGKCEFLQVGHGVASIGRCLNSMVESIHIIYTCTSIVTGNIEREGGNLSWGLQTGAR